jgi:hypothetical protein
MVDPAGCPANGTGMTSIKVNPALRFIRMFIVTVTLLIRGVNQDVGGIIIMISFEVHVLPSANRV